MISFYETRLLKNIRAVALHPEVAPYMFSSIIPDAKTLSLKAVNDPNITIYALRINNKLAGLGLFVMKDNIAIVDVAFLPNFSGKDKKDVATKASQDYVSKKHPRAIIGKIRRTNKRSLIFAQWCNFHVEHIDDDYFYIRQNYGQ